MPLNKLPVSLRVVLAFTHDIAAAVLVWVLAYSLRFNFEIPAAFSAQMVQTLWWVIPMQAAIFWFSGLYRGIWRYASLPDLRRIVIAVLFSAAALALVLAMSRHTSIPRSVLVLDPILLVLLMGGSRLAYRVWKEYRVYGSLRHTGRPVLVLGAGDDAVSLLKELERSQEWRVVGLLDDAPDKAGRQLYGVKVLGALTDLARCAARTGAEHAIIAMPSATHGVRRRAADLCAQAGIATLTVPSFEEMLSGKVAISQLRRIEVEDLLGREPVLLDNDGLHALMTGRTVMVTGAGGSIGSELCRQIARFQPGLLVFYELSEFALYRLEQEFAQHFPDIRIACLVGDVKNRTRLDQALERYRPAVMFHAAAYKHVPLMESDNAWEAVQNNTLGTYTAAMAAMAAGVEKFVLISTDKAVNPTNVMGATKRLAEIVCQGLQRPDATRFVVVRFGNVLGSSGSVVPKFQEQIARGGPVTVTHPEITRYFMSIPEAAQLVLQAGLMGQGGEIFVLDMGEPVKIADLARDMIRLSGYSEDDIGIVYSGLRPGEKLYEELLADQEETLSTPHPKLRRARAREVAADDFASATAWIGSASPLDEPTVKTSLLRWVPEYRQNPQEG